MAQADQRESRGGRADGVIAQAHWTDMDAVDRLAERSEFPFLREKPSGHLYCICRGANKKSVYWTEPGGMFPIRRGVYDDVLGQACVLFAKSLCPRRDGGG